MRKLITLLTATWLFVGLLASYSLHAREQQLTITSALPLPNYSLTVDQNDLKQLTDGEISSYPIWRHRASVGWAQRTPVVLKGRLHQRDAGMAKMTLRLLVAKGVYAAVYPPRRIDVYCGSDKPGWFHAGASDGPTEAIPDRAVSWIDIEMAGSCKSEFALVIHATGAFLMLDEIAFKPDLTGATKDPESPSYMLPASDLVTDSLAKLQIQLMDRQKKRDEAAFDVAGIQESRVWLASPWLDLSPEKQLVRSHENGYLDVSLTGNSAAQYIVAIANGASVPRSYTVVATGDTVEAASVFRLAPVMTADGHLVYDPIVPLVEKSITIAPRGVEYFWLKHSTIYGDGVITVSVASPDGWHRNLRVVLRTFNIATVPQESVPDVGVWAYSSDTPVWASASKPDVVNELRDAGVNVFVVHPDSIPDPRKPASWLEREQLLRADLRLYKGAGTVLLYLAWDDRLGSAVQKPVQLRRDISMWLVRLRDVLHGEGYGYEDWALYPIDEPTSADYDLLLEVSDWIKSVDPKVRLYANPGRIAERDLRFGGKLSALVELIDLWQPQIGMATDLLASRLVGKQGMWIYQVGDAPAKSITPQCYRKLAWEADRYGAHGFGFWSFSDTGGTTAWNDLDGVRPDWSVVYESPDGIISSRRWEAFKAGIQDYRQLAACRTGNSAPDEFMNSTCVNLRRDIDRQFGAVACR